MLVYQELFPNSITDCGFAGDWFISHIPPNVMNKLPPTTFNCVVSKIIIRRKKINHNTLSPVLFTSNVERRKNSPIIEKLENSILTVNSTLSRDLFFSKASLSTLPYCLFTAVFSL